MKRLLFASTNRGKLGEVSALLKDHFEVLGPEAPVPNILEDGDSYFENALKKAIGFQARYHVPVLCDDSGLEVDALKGAPGIHSAYYGGKNLSWPERWEVVLSELKNQSVRTARFRCVLCYYDGKSVPRFFEGTVEGEIAPAATGAEGFGYDPLFYSLDLKKSLGEATPAEKATVSHRARAIQAFLHWTLSPPLK